MTAEQAKQHAAASVLSTSSIWAAMLPLIAPQAAMKLAGAANNTTRQAARFLALN